MTAITDDARAVAHWAQHGTSDDVDVMRPRISTVAELAAFVAEQMRGANWSRTRDELTITIAVDPQAMRAWQESGLL